MNGVRDPNGTRYLRAGVGLALLAVLALGAAQAQADEHHGRDERHGGRGEHFDNRYRHDHYYPSRGAYVRALPDRAVALYRGGGRYFYSGGVWYAPRGPRFIVVAAPVGIFVPLLPPFYTTLWVGGLPYYYANDTYYVWRGEQGGYEVVEPPDDQGATTQAPPGDELYIYPQSGQSDEQQASDKYDCHKWASTQTGFDPTQSAGGVPPEQTQPKRAEYQRAIRACLEGRGYSVR
jgi:hypothetical protein